MIKVAAIKCLKCGDVIYSRARHDFRRCGCKSTAVDGGFDYTRVLWSSGMKPAVTHELRVNATKKELYDDWNEGTNKFGRIEGNDSKRP